MATYGKLVLTLPTGLEQEFELGKRNITLGRATTSDIVLSDTRVSRTHASVECSPAGCTLIDLGSTNGTRVNGIVVDRAALNPGDTLILGNSSLRFENASPEEPPEMTIIDSEAELNATMEQMTMTMSLNDTSSPRLVIYSPDKTWEVPLDVDALTIGRLPENELVLDFEKVSRRHARLERSGNDFLLKDLQSTNGTWIIDKRVDTHILRNGDVFRIGRVQLAFKGGFAQEDLTIAGESLPLLRATRRPIIFVPGMMGSELWQGSERVWPNVKILFKNPEIFQLTDKSPLEPRGVMGELVIVPNLIKVEGYTRLGDYLVEELGYERGKDFLEFAYDWRRDVRLSAQRLAETIDAWGLKSPVTIIAHSLGTLVSRYYVERLDGKKKVERLLLLGGPHQGAPKAATSLMLGPKLLPFGLLGERLRQVVSTFPSSYQILPTYLCATDQNGKQVNICDDDSWLSEKQRPLLHQARQFRRELGSRSSIPTISIFGYGLKTITRIRMQRDSQGDWKNVSFEVAPSGDSTVPENSAVLEGSEIHPVQQYHGTLHVDNDVKMRLKLELTRQ